MKIFSRVLLFGFGLVSAALILFLILLFIQRESYLWNNMTIGGLVIAPILYLLTLLFGLARGHGARINILLLTFSLLFALYAAELFFILSGPYITLPKEYDRRSKLEVVLEMREKGQDVVPSAHPKNIMPGSLNVGGTPVLPLGGIAQATTVFCNETGSYYIYEADEFGFTNPRGLHVGPLTVGLIGDSFTQGFCAPFGTSYADRVRAEIPRTLNLGNNGNGPLVELASLREYLEPLKPTHVFWIYFEGNDPEDLSREIQHPLLKRYLDERDFTQNLKANAERYDDALRKHIEEKLQQEIEVHKRPELIRELPEKLKLFSKLWHVRALLGLTDIKREWRLRRWEAGVPESEVEEAFGRILDEAKSRVEAWGGKFTFVYLPSYRTFGYELVHPWRERVLELVKVKGITIIDVLPIFAEHADPISLFNYRKEAHYTKEGNQIVADYIVKAVKGSGDLVTTE